MLFCSFAESKQKKQKQEGRSFFYYYYLKKMKADFQKCPQTNKRNKLLKKKKTKTKTKEINTIKK